MHSGEESTDLRRWKVSPATMPAKKTTRARSGLGVLMDTAGLGFLQTKASSNRAKPLADRRLVRQSCRSIKEIEKWKSGNGLNRF